MRNARNIKPKSGTSLKLLGVLYYSVPLVQVSLWLDLLVKLHIENVFTALLQPGNRIQQYISQSEKGTQGPKTKMAAAVPLYLPLCMPPPNYNH